MRRVNVSPIKNSRQNWFDNLNAIIFFQYRLLNGNPFDCSNAANAWLKGWLASSSDSPVLTGECSGTSETIFEALDALAEPASALFSFEELEYRVAEDAGVAEVVVTRTGIVGTIVQFDVTVTGDTALGGQDFAPTAGSTHTMLEGQTRVGIDILLIDDPIIETDESFTVSITIKSRGEANMGTVVDGTTRVTIQDNDSPVPTMMSTTASTIRSTTASTQAENETTNPVVMMTTAGQSPKNITDPSMGDFKFGVDIGVGNTIWIAFSSSQHFL
nr:uncharacterized protein LOC129278020 [Lytechinus pictus]